MSRGTVLQNVSRGSEGHRHDGASPGGCRSPEEMHTMSGNYVNLPERSVAPLYREQMEAFYAGIEEDLLADELRLMGRGAGHE